MKTIIHLSLALLASGCATSGGAVATNLETPAYQTLVEEGQFTLRRYEPYVVAQTLVAKESMDAASRTGFRRLAGYIFGGNRGRADIAMTAPVTAEPAAERGGEKIAMTAPVGAQPAAEGWRITFMMPGKYDLESLPVPNDERVTFALEPEQCRAVVTFSWLTTEERVKTHTDALLAWVKQRGLTTRGEPVIARYNDPFTLPWRRTNELWLEVEGCEDPAR
jgi:hypothetical protein